MTRSNQELTSYRLQRARQTLEDARILADARRWNPCVNRLYYACFYAVSALLIQEGDYMDFVSFQESQIRRWIPEAEAFVEDIAVLIESSEK